MYEDPHLEKEYKRNLEPKGEGGKLYVHIDHALNAMTRKYAILATNELGLQIRSLCPLKDVKSWLNMDKTTKAVVIQAVLVIENTCPQSVFVLCILVRSTYI